MRKSLILQLAIQILLLIPRIYCESYCEIPCPLHAECTRDDHCECDIGYEQFISEFNGLPSCRALCDQPCGKHGICTEPNQCACIQGYTKVFDQCLPTCTSGCPNGKCVAPEMCDCGEGHESVDGTCKELNDGSADDKVECKNGIIWYSGQCVQTTTSTTTRVSHITNEIYKNEETEETTVINMFDFDGILDNIYPTQDEDNKCPFGYIYHRNKCRSEIELQEQCSPELCGPNTKCVDYEICECLPGFSWHYVDGGRNLRCASAEQAQQEHLQKAQPDNYKQGKHWPSTLYTSLGVCCTLSALLVLLFTLLKKYK